MMLVVLASAMALFRATLSSDDPLFPTDGTAGGPHPVNGVWAALPPDCATPATLDLSAWPKCATPIGFVDGEVAALQKPAPDAGPSPSGDFTSIARTHYWVAPGAPAVVQVDVPIMFSHSTVYIALQPDALDDANGFTAATGWPIGCPPSGTGGVVVDGARCSASTSAAVRAAAAFAPDPAKTYRLVRIQAPAAAGKSGEEMQDDPEAVMPEATSTPSTPPTAPPGDVGEAPLPPAADVPGQPQPGPPPQVGPAPPSMN